MGFDFTMLTMVAKANATHGCLGQKQPISTLNMLRLRSLDHATILLFALPKDKT